MSDVVFVLCKESLGFLDPGAFISSKFGDRFDYTRNNEEPFSTETITKQLMISPFNRLSTQSDLGLFNFQPSQSFNGTIIRLPLRTGKT